MQKKTFYVTTPIYYPSGKLHIGHLYTTTLAWVLKNYKTMLGYDAKFLTGADEHGQKIANKAKEMHLSEMDFVNQQVAQFKKLWNKAEIDYDYFSRTTNPQHKAIVKNVFQMMLDKGYIYKGEYKGLYSISDEEFLTPIQARLHENKYYHPTSGHELVEISEESYFFKMSHFQNWWKDAIATKKDFILPKKNILELENNFVNKGLEDLSITRVSFEWGIKIDNDPKHVVYVWLDALFNYLSALGFSSTEDQDYQKYWVNGTEIVHLVGKEISRFHCIYWPIMLESLNIKLPTSIISHGWLITPEGKMSKSKGNVVDPLILLDKFHPEVVKYFFVSQIGIGNDGIFDEQLLKNVYNTDLANNYGNLLSRTIAMILQSFPTIPVKYQAQALEQIDQDIFTKMKILKQEYCDAFDAFQLDRAFKLVITFSSELNSYIDKTTPWLLKENLKRLEIILNTLLNGLYTITTLLSPVLPNKTKLALKQLNISKIDFNLISDYNKFDNSIVQKAEALFQRMK